MTRVSIEEIAKRLQRNNGRTTIVDSRSEDAWNRSAVKAGGAIRIPPNDAEKHIPDIDRDDHVVIYCT